MKLFKKILSYIIIIFLMNSLLPDHSKKALNIVSAETNPIRVSVFLYNSSDDFISSIRQNLENIQKENLGKIEYTFYDGKSDQSVQDTDLNKILKEGTDLILLNIVDRAYTPKVINRIKEHNLPVILFNREPLTPVPMQSYNRALYIGADAKLAGTLQGKMLVNTWNESKRYLDQNKDRIMQYVMLQGQGDNTEAIERTKYSVLAIEQSGIRTQQVALEICNWREDLAYNATKSLFDKYKDLIEVIIANDDSMAIGAVKALQEYGYNLGDKSKTIPIVGVDVRPQAKEFIEKGYMLGSVYQEPKAYAEALYACGMNLINFKSPIEGTKYTLDDTLVSIRIPHTDYLYKNIFVRVIPR